MINFQLLFTVQQTVLSLLSQETLLFVFVYYTRAL